ncbi:uncharacterized protein LOC125113254 [Phacochoerus africanus]|uniref:uncharacterized protein LOC125113254 n=1 Tax=Phacochoerus africanus TaxID=41426 RepID=UPI001FDA698F|nr:uncharacterized protein LOC125113254 [Phacochoerus africanus]
MWIRGGTEQLLSQRIYRIRSQLIGSAGLHSLTLQRPPALRAAGGIQKGNHAAPRVPRPVLPPRRRHAGCPRGRAGHGKYGQSSRRAPARVRVLETLLGKRGARFPGSGSSPHPFTATLALAAFSQALVLERPGAFPAALCSRPAFSMFLQRSPSSTEVWNQRWQGKWHALFPGAGLRSPPPAPRHPSGEGGQGYIRLLSGARGGCRHWTTRAPQPGPLSQHWSLSSLGGAQAPLRSQPVRPPGGARPARGWSCFLPQDWTRAGGVAFQDVPRAGCFPVNKKTFIIVKSSNMWYVTGWSSWRAVLTCFRVEF